MGGTLVAGLPLNQLARFANGCEEPGTFMQTMQRVIISTLPELFEDVIRVLIRKGVLIDRKLRDLGVIAGSVGDEVSLSELFAVPGVRDVELDMAPTSDDAAS
jgi:hypothetical protein